MAHGNAQWNPFLISTPGASAGGLGAFQHHFKHLPVDTGIGLAIVPRLFKDHPAGGAPQSDGPPAWVRLWGPRSAGHWSLCLSGIETEHEEENLCAHYAPGTGEYGRGIGSALPSPNLGGV